MFIHTYSLESRSISSITTAQTASPSPWVELTDFVDSGYESEDEITIQGLALRMQDSVDMRRR